MTVHVSEMRVRCFVSTIGRFFILPIFFSIFSLALCTGSGMETRRRRRFVVSTGRFMVVITSFYEAKSLIQSSTTLMREGKREDNHIEI